MNEKSKKNKRAIIALSVLMALGILGSVPIGIIGYSVRQHVLVEEYGHQAMQLAQTVASNLDGDRYHHIVQTGEQDEYWYEVKAYLDRVRTETRVLWLYALMPTPIDGGYFVFADACDLLGEMDDGEDFLDILGYDDLPGTVMQTISTGQPSRTGLEVYDHDWYVRAVSGVAPIFDSRDNVVGVVIAEKSMEAALSGLWLFGVRLFAVVLGLGLIPLPIIIILATRR
jgi:sensor histidine kinase regulating citrate/malate metabolism